MRTQTDTAHGSTGMVREENDFDELGLDACNHSIHRHSEMEIDLSSMGGMGRNETERLTVLRSTGLFNTANRQSADSLWVRSVRARFAAVDAVAFLQQHSGMAVLSYSYGSAPDWFASTDAEGLVCQQNGSVEVSSFFEQQLGVVVSLDVASAAVRQRQCAEGTPEAIKPNRTATRMQTLETPIIFAILNIPPA